MEDFIKTYVGTASKFFNFRIKGSTTRIASLVMIATGVMKIKNGDFAGGAESWAIGAAFWGLRDALD